MKTPLWMLNSALVGLLFFVFFVLFFLQKEVPKRRSLVPTQTAQPDTQPMTQVNIARIYENDLFGTYVRQLPTPEKKEALKPQIPQPPAPTPSPQPKEAKPEFMSPLSVALKGIIYSNNTRDNRAIIVDNKTKNESLYRVGDQVQDADVIHIDKNKVILIRSNGQQETIFISEAEAKQDPIYKDRNSWENIIEQVSDTVFKIDPKSFTNRVKSLAEVIDMLDVTAAFVRGSNIGCQIGNMHARSAGFALGLQPGDIITRINGIPATSTQNRVRIYKSIMSTTPDSSIQAHIVRKNQDMQLTYTLQALKKGTTGEAIPPGEPLQMASAHRNTNEATTARKILHNDAANKSTVDTFKMRDRNAMKQFGSKDAYMQRNRA
jgi:type II secretory pathway component PulC